MILYNIRTNGPFEYDKFILNIGQFHNECNNVKHAYQDSMLQEQIQLLDDRIKDYTKSNNMLNQLALLKKAVTS